MEKKFKFFITDYMNFYDVVNSPIRNKSDIIKVLLLSMKHILLGKQVEDEDKGEVIISVEKNSRIYFICKKPNELPNKYYSFIFPFFLIENQNKEWNIKCKISQEIISSQLINNLLILEEKGWFSDKNINFNDIDEFACGYIEELEDYYLENKFNSNAEISSWAIAKQLLTFEPGYIRYDYDPEYEDGDKHPLNHLDINYDSSGTFKLGFGKTIKIKERLNFEQFKDILENGKAQAEKCYKII